ncbi:MAG: hypothetical protein AABY30_00060 [Candidatus Thermoplasmatota archaeon]
MVAPVNELGCPACGTALGPYELLCSACGAKLRHVLPIENLPPRLRELHDISEGAIAQAAAKTANAHRQGVRVDLAEDLLAMSRKAALQRDYPVALDLASKSGSEAEDLSVQFEALQNRMRAAKRAMEVAREDGADLSDSEELLEMAHEAAMAGDYKSALRYALKATQRAERGRQGYQAWKVEISDFLK